MLVYVTVPEVGVYPVPPDATLADDANETELRDAIVPETKVSV